MSKPPIARVPLSLAPCWEWPPPQRSPSCREVTEATGRPGRWTPAGTRPRPWRLRSARLCSARWPGACWPPPTGGGRAATGCWPAVGGRAERCSGRDSAPAGRAGRPCARGPAGKTVAIRLRGTGRNRATRSGRVETGHVVVLVAQAPIAATRTEMRHVRRGRGRLGAVVTTTPRNRVDTWLGRQGGRAVWLNRAGTRRRPHTTCCVERHFRRLLGRAQAGRQGCRVETVLCCTTPPGSARPGRTGGHAQPFPTTSGHRRRPRRHLRLDVVLKREHEMWPPSRRSAAEHAAARAAARRMAWAGPAPSPCRAPPKPAYPSTEPLPVFKGVDASR